MNREWPLSVRANKLRKSKFLSFGRKSWKLCHISPVSLEIFQINLSKFYLNREKRKDFVIIENGFQISLRYEEKKISATSWNFWTIQGVREKTRAVQRVAEHQWCFDAGPIAKHKSAFQGRSQKKEMKYELKVLSLFI